MAHFRSYLSGPRRSRALDLDAGLVMLCTDATAAATAVVEMHAG